MTPLRRGGPLAQQRRGRVVRQRRSGEQRVACSCGVTIPGWCAPYTVGGRVSGRYVRSGPRSPTGTPMPHRAPQPKGLPHSDRALALGATSAFGIAGSSSATARPSPFPYERISVPDPSGRPPNLTRPVTYEIDALPRSAAGRSLPSWPTARPLRAWQQVAAAQVFESSDEPSWRPRRPRPARPRSACTWRTGCCPRGAWRAWPWSRRRRTSAASGRWTRRATASISSPTGRTARGRSRGTATACRSRTRRSRRGRRSTAGAARSGRRC